jgi:hypothetical protein
MPGLNRTIVGLVGAALLVISGCDGGNTGPPATASTEEVEVKGTVTVNGKPVTEGEVTFDAGNNQRKVGSRTAKIGEGGAYTIKTFVGTNSVTVHGPEIDKDPKLATNGQNIEVKPGENNVPIDVK